MAKKTEAGTKQKQITAKQIGQNIMIVFPDKKTFSKKFADKDEREGIKKMIENYNKKNSDTTLNKLVKIFNPSKEKVEKKEMEKKGLKKAVKKEKKVVDKRAKAPKKEETTADLIAKVRNTELSEEEATELRSILKGYEQTHEKKEEVAPVKTTTQPRRGEY